MYYTNFFFVGRWGKESKVFFLFSRKFLFFCYVTIFVVYIRSKLGILALPLRVSSSIDGQSKVKKERKVQVEKRNGERAVPCWRVSGRVCPVKVVSQTKTTRNTHTLSTYTHTHMYRAYREREKR